MGRSRSNWTSFVSKPKCSLFHWLKLSRTSFGETRFDQSKHDYRPTFLYIASQRSDSTVSIKKIHMTKSLSINIPGYWGRIRIHIHEISRARILSTRKFIRKINIPEVEPKKIQDNKLISHDSWQLSIISLSFKVSVLLVIVHLDIFVSQNDDIHSHSSSAF